MSKDYGSWSLAALKAELEKRKAKRTGKKAVLVQRLQEYDILFGDVINNPDVTYKIQVPDARSFQDVNSDMSLPELDMRNLETFCSIAEHENNIHAMNMYKENYLLTFRVAADGQYYFISSICASEMRKNISYNIIIKYEENTIIETQCECAAGVGPHAQCKHVVTVLHGLLDFITNKNINVRSTCTSTLQTFHHPQKFYKGAPVKSEDLKLKNKDKNYKKIINFDPRPAGTGSSADCYINFFKNHCINFVSLQKRPMPILQITKAADKKALYADHDYLEKTHEQYFLDTQLLTPAEQIKLEETTRNNNKIWKKERLRRLQSSNFGKICKAKENQKKKIATSLLKNIEIITQAIQHGRKYEKKAIKMFTQKTGLAVKDCGIIIHNKLQFLASTPDGLVGENAVVEVKCPFTAANEKICPEKINFIELCEKSGQWRLKRNHDYFYQVQGQLLCTKRAMCYFCIYTLKDFYIIKVERDEDFIYEITENLKEFYENTFIHISFYAFLFIILDLKFTNIATIKVISLESKVSVWFIACVRIL